MRLTPKAASSILSGQKTQHRMLKVPSTRSELDNGEVFNRRNVDVGTTLAVSCERTEVNDITGEREGRWATICHVRVTAMYEQELCLISDGEARAEGYPSRDAFFDAWNEAHGWRPVTLAGGEPTPVYGHIATVVCFEPVVIDRYLAPVNRADSEGRSYVSSPAEAIDADPAVDAETQTWITKEARENWNSPEARAARARAREQRSLEHRLAEARHKARMAGIDIDTDERVIEDRIARMERKAAREAA